MPKTISQPLTVAAPVVLGAVSQVGAQISSVQIPATDNEVLVQLQNPGTATVWFEGSPDSGITWDNLAGLRTDDQVTWDSNGSAGITPPAAANRAWTVPCPGHNQFRVGATAITGSPKVSIISITCPPPQQIPPAAITTAQVQPLAFPRNLIDGGDFTTNPWQRGTSQAADIVGTLTYGPDRFFMVGSASGTASAIDWSQNADSTLPGFNQSWRVQRKATNTSTNVINVGQVLESGDVIKLQGQQVTLSFWAKADANYSGGSLTVAINHSITAGNDTAAHLVAASTNWQAVPSVINATQAITSGWIRYSFTGTVPVNATQLGLLISWTPVGTAGTTDAVDFQGFQLEVGNVASNFEHQDLEIVLAICQRYYVRITETNGGTFAVGVPTGANAQTYPLWLPTPMRTAPTVTVTVGGFKTNTDGAGNATPTGLAAGAAHSPTLITLVTTLTQTAAAHANALVGTGTTGFIEAAAEF